jgi:hypothetical protein
MSTTNQELLLVMVGVLLPIVPSYILYKALPSTGRAEGPFKGLKIKLSGAFAGYFLLVLLVFGFFVRPHPAKYEVWEVTGTLAPDQPESPLDGRLILSLSPPNPCLLSDGRFVFQIVKQPGPDGELRFPILAIEHPDYQPVSIDLNRDRGAYGQPIQGIDKSSIAKSICFDKPVPLKRKSTVYNPTGPAPKEVTAIESEVHP